MTTAARESTPERQTTLVDTNVALRLAQVGHPYRQIALNALDSLILGRRETIAIAAQSVYEMYVVLTRPTTANGIGLTSTAAYQQLTATKSAFVLLKESDDVFAIWERLVTRYNVVGKLAHDARLVATMLATSVAAILTFNDVDFRRFTEIQVLNPYDVLSMPRP